MFPQRHSEIKELDLSDTQAASDLLAGVITTSLEIVFEADITIAGGLTSGAVVSTAVEDFIKEVIVQHDDRKLVDQIDGIGLAEITRGFSSPGAAGFQVDDLANGDIQANSIVRHYYRIPCELPTVINSIETAWALPLHRRRWFISAKPSGALSTLAASYINGGDRTVTVNSAKLRVRQWYQTEPVGFRPVEVLAFRSVDSKPIVASVATHELELRTTNPLLGLIVMELRDGVPVNGIVNNWTLEHDNGEMYREYADRDFEQAFLSHFPGVQAARRAGVNFIDFTNATPQALYGTGRIGQQLDGGKLTRPRLKLDVTRTSGTEIIRGIHVEGELIPGWTQLNEAPLQPAS